MPYIYVLHFDEAITDHARHYVGSTADVKTRLTQHARGQGSRLCEVCLERNIDWQLASLFFCNTMPKKIERLLKNQKNAQRFCNICIEQLSPFRHAFEYPLEKLPFPLRSELLR